MRRRFLLALPLAAIGTALKAVPVARMCTLRLPAKDMWWIYTCLISDSWHCRENGLEACEDRNDRVIKEIKRQIPDID